MNGVTWFSSNVIYGYYLGPYSNAPIHEPKDQPFEIFALIPEIYNGVDTEKIESLVHLYIGFNPQFRTLENIKCIANCLTEYVIAMKIPIRGDLNFYTGINAENIITVFDYKNELLELV